MAHPEIGANSGPGAADSPANLEQRLRELEGRLREMQEREHRRPRALVERMVPPEVRAHLRAARREQLLAVRALVDSAITRLDEGPRERPRRPESVRID